MAELLSVGDGCSHASGQHQVAEQEPTKCLACGMESPAPWPGIYHHVSFDEYRSWDAVNATACKWGNVSMEHMHASLLGQLDGDSDAQRFGRAMHARLLEPLVYQSDFLQASPCQAILKSGPRKDQPCGDSAKYLVDGQWRCGSHAAADAEVPGNFVSPSESISIEQIAAKVATHPVVNLIKQHGGFECSMVWQYEELRMKARLDKYIKGAACPNTIADLKKVQRGQGTGDAFSRAVERYGYDIQAAVNVDAAFALDGIAPMFVWVVIEDKYPFAINVIRADQETLAIGRHKYRQALDTYRACMLQDTYPGYADDIVMGGLSTFAKKKYKGIV